MTVLSLCTAWQAVNSRYKLHQAPPIPGRTFSLRRASSTTTAGQTSMWNKCGADYCSTRLFTVSTSLGHPWWGSPPRRACSCFGLSIWLPYISLMARASADIWLLTMQGDRRLDNACLWPRAHVSGPILDARFGRIYVGASYLFKRSHGPSAFPWGFSGLLPRRLVLDRTGNQRHQHPAGEKAGRGDEPRTWCATPWVDLDHPSLHP